MQAELSKKVGEYQGKFRKELAKLQAQLNEALAVVNELLNEEVTVETRKKFNDSEFIEMFGKGMTNSQIAKETGYNASYISTKRKKLMK